LLAGIAGAAVGLAAWISLGLATPGFMRQAQAVGTPAVTQQASIAPGPPPEPTARQAFQSCLKKLHADAWLTELENGLNVETRSATLQSLAENGLALALLPAGLRLPEASAAQANNSCSWDNRAGSWVLWRPVHLPFELASHAQGEAVRWLQTQLAETNLYTAPVDGLAGPRTLAALNVFQRQHGMPADGNVDAWTLFLLEHGIGRLAG
jgi:hypothetical protein